MCSQVVILAVGITAAVVASLTLFTLQTKVDLTSAGPRLCVCAQGQRQQSGCVRGGGRGTVAQRYLYLILTNTFSSLQVRDAVGGAFYPIACGEVFGAAKESSKRGLPLPCPWPHGSQP